MSMQPTMYYRERSANYHPASYNVTAEQLFDLFGKFGPIRYATTSS